MCERVDSQLHFLSFAQANCTIKPRIITSQATCKPQYYSKTLFKCPNILLFLLQLKWQLKNFISWYSYLYTIHSRSLSFSSSSLLLGKCRKMSRRACQALVAARGSGATRVCVWVRPGTEWAGHHIHSPPVPRLLHLPRHLRHHATCVAAYTETAFCTRLLCVISPFI